MEQLIDSNTVAIVVVNPSNPCGSVYSRQHLLDTLAVAERHFLPIIADEIYAGMVFEGQQFHSIASLSKNVPVLSCGGIGKKYLVPGWRVGWILIYDKNEILKKEVWPLLYVPPIPYICYTHILPYTYKFFEGCKLHKILVLIYYTVGMGN